MCQPKSVELTVAERQHRVMKMHLKGTSQQEMADRLGVSQPTISRDVREIEARWQAESARQLAIVREKELRKLDLIEREAWTGWERSLEAAAEADDGDKENPATGDYRFLVQVLKCIVLRRALLGPEPFCIPASGEQQARLVDADDDARLARLEVIMEKVKAIKGAAAEEAEAEIPNPNLEIRNKPQDGNSN